MVDLAFPKGAIYCPSELPHSIIFFGGVISVPGVFLNEDDYNFDLALRRFKKQVEKAGILSEMKKRQHYEKPSVMRKKKKAAARKRLMKKMRKLTQG